MQVNKIITAEDRKARLPWWGVLCVMLSALPLLLVFDHFGKSAFALPTIDSVAVIACAIGLRWRLRRRVWFWFTMIVFAGLHVLLLLYVPWTDKWVPAPIVILIGLADLYAIFAVIYALEKFIDGPKATKALPKSHHEHAHRQSNP